MGVRQLFFYPALSYYPCAKPESFFSVVGSDLTVAFAVPEFFQYTKRFLPLHRARIPHEADRVELFNAP